MFEPSLSVTGVGSVPFTDPREALAFVREYAPRVPFVPEPPSEMLIEPLRDLERYFSEISSRQIVVRRGELETFIRAATGGVAAPTPPSFNWEGVLAVKAQLVGPVTLLSCLIYDGLPLIQNRAVAEAVTCCLSARARSIVDSIRSDGHRAIFVFDEPMLGSADAAGLDLIRRTVTSVRLRGALSGIHSCAPLPETVRSLGAEILSFDLSFPNQIALAAGSAKYLSLGLVPTLGPLPSLEVVQAELRAALVQAGEDPGALARRLLVTTACGLGLNTPEDAAARMNTLRDVSRGFTYPMLDVPSS